MNPRISAPKSIAAGYQSLTPLLIDIKGWQGEKAEGMTMDAGGMKMTNAFRTYTKGDNQLTATLMIGSAAMTQAQTPAMTMETPDVKASISKIDGFKVMTSYDKNEKAGVITVFLAEKGANGAIFALSYEGLSDKEATKLAKRFNWKKMKAAVKKLL